LFPPEHFLAAEGGLYVDERRLYCIHGRRIIISANLITFPQKYKFRSIKNSAATIEHFHNKLLQNGHI
ncbi:MAG: hypothetical protein K2K37_13095, partial [Muribaculaceae bacterium]|nr:hypothetical protein [Muribaculaceae bacterium]